MRRRKRALVVADEAVVAHSFGRALRRAGYEVALAGSAAQAMSALSQGVLPDVVVLDLELGDGKGEEIVEALANGSGFAPPRIGVITGVGDAGRCLDLMLRGCSVLGKPVNARVLTRYVRWLFASHDPLEAFATRHRLSRRETELLGLFARAVPTKELPDAMSCSPHTVQTYLRRILRKTGCTSRQALLAALLSAVRSSSLAELLPARPGPRGVSRNLGT